MSNDLSTSRGFSVVTSSPQAGRMSVAQSQPRPFNPKTFLEQPGEGKTTLQCQKQQILFAQGDTANAVFYIVQGLVKLTVVSPQGKEAVVAILESGDFIGEACLAEQGVYMATATSLNPSTIVRISKSTMKRMLLNEPALSELLMSHLLSRNTRIQEDLVDHLLNTAEKRLARMLLLLAHVEEDNTPRLVIPKISQETLAEMVGTTRSRVSFFLNRFKRLGFIQYMNNNAGYQVHRSLMNIIRPV
ncbi:MAG TPA: Crp/Fnr family transcriptional regulator [Nitrospiraceae bacterium]|nr:Crp/Fnr family transcriptional regulator [Nitrospiraceae bacterium]